MSVPNPVAVIPTTSRLLRVTYVTIAVAALIATHSQNIAYLGSPSLFSAVGSFLRETKVTPASRSIHVDIMLFFLAASILMVIEARKHGIPFVWAYIIGGAVIAISVTFPIFLLARELRLRKTDPSRLCATDTLPLLLLAGLVAGLVMWVDLV